jgi:phosphoserine aminotransferase
MAGPDVPDIRLPAELRPSDGRFGSGPSKVRPEAVAALAAAGPTYLGTSHRQEGVRSVVRRVRSALRELFGLPDDYEVVLGVGGTSTFWDAAALCLIEQRSQHLVFGEFSGRFAEIVRAAPHLEDPDVLETPPGTHPWPVARADVDAFALTHNETSTGVTMPVRRPDDAAGLVLVDATSGAGAIPVDPLEFDAYYFAPQKTFGSEGGLWLALCSPAAVERIERVARSDRWVPAILDLAVALENSRKDQTLNTPALATLFLVANQLDWILAQGGLDWAVARCERSAEILYGWAEASPFATPFVPKRSERSPVTGTIDFDENVPAATLAAVLRANGIVDTEPYRKLGRNQLRIAMFPAIDPDDVSTLTGAIDYIVERLQ